VRSVETIGKDAIEPQVGRKQIAVIRRKNDGVRVWTLLAGGGRAGACVLIECDGGSQTTGGLNRQYGNASARMVCDGQTPSGAIERDVTGTAASRGDLIQCDQPAGCAVDAEGADGIVAVADFVRRIKKAAIGMHSKKGRFGSFGFDADAAQASRCG